MMTNTKYKAKYNTIYSRQLGWWEQVKNTLKGSNFHQGSSRVLKKKWQKSRLYLQMNLDVCLRARKRGNFFGFFFLWGGGGGGGGGVGGGGWR